jgi:hypothetical protein
MSVISRSISVQTSPENAYNYLADVKNHAEWGAHQLEVTRVDSGPVVVGSKWETVGHQFGSQPGTVTITELVPNQRIAYESDGKVGLFRHAFHMEPSQGTSLMLIKTMEPVTVRNLPLKVLGPIVRGFIAPKNLDGDLARIKARLEGA